MPTSGERGRTRVDLPDGTQLWTRRLPNNGCGADGIRPADQDSSGDRTGSGGEDRQDYVISQAILNKAIEVLYGDISNQPLAGKDDLRDALAYALQEAGVRIEFTIPAAEPDFFDSQDEAARMELDDDAVEDKDWWPAFADEEPEKEEDDNPWAEIEDSIVFEEIDEEDDEEEDEILPAGLVLAQSPPSRLAAAQQEASFNSVKTKGIYIKHISDFLKPEASLYHGRNKDSMKIRDDADGSLWRSGKGLDMRIIHIKNMDNNHLYNSIRYLAAKNERSAMLEKELEFRLSKWRKDNGLEVPKVEEEEKSTPTITRKIIRS